MGDRIRHRDEYGYTTPEMTITEFRETEVVAVDDSKFEWRLDPKDFFNGKILKVDPAV